MRGVVQSRGGRFSTALGIDLTSGKAGEIYKWFLASILYGARISEATAANTYRELARSGVLTPRAVVKTGWDGLVRILDRGGYVRYDFKTATKLLEINRALLGRFGGNLNALHDAAHGARDLERRLRGIGKGFGEVTAGIFLRELRGIWPKARPLSSAPALDAARDLGIIPPRLADRQKALDLLQGRWRRSGMPARDFADFEAALARHGLALRRERTRRAAK